MLTFTLNQSSHARTAARPVKVTTASGQQPQVRCARARACSTAPVRRQAIVCRAATAMSRSASEEGSVSITAADGAPEPLGPSAVKNGVNFAVYSKHATGMKLCLFNESNEAITELDMKRSGDVWHVTATGCPKRGILYGVRVFGKGGWETGERWAPERVLLDPYTPLVSGRRVFGQRDKFEQFEPEVGSTFRGTFDLDAKPFDWGGVKPPGHDLKDLIIYEVPVRTFTASETSGVAADRRGSYLGFADKAQHLKKLGVNAVELLPVFEYDELEFQRGKNKRDHMINIWGYSHIVFFAPMSRFAAGGGGPHAAAQEFKQMVKTLHAAGIEVLLDVVYNHTAEGSDVNPYILSHRCIDCRTYYQQNLEQYEQLLNYSGCGNTVNANNPAVAQQIADSLRHWVEEYHVDGFRFDLATSLCRDSDGTLLGAPPLIRAISKDPVLSKVKLIAEPWDCGGYQVGSFPNWDIWAEWNGIYRDVVRRFIKGDKGLKSDFATRIAGSADLYHNHNRKASDSINFIVAHDGFTLADLVSYNHKHNEANGEDGNDGTNDNFSWNCGVEGHTDNGDVRALRWRQMRNFQMVLMLSRGTPMIVSGDEYGHTRGGNNNWYGHDTAMSHFDWDVSQEQRDFFNFYSALIKFRKTCPLLGREEFLKPDEITWHEDDWGNKDSSFLAFTLHGKHFDYADLYVAFNAHAESVQATLPPPPHGTKWCRIADTNLKTDRQWVDGGNKGVEPVYTITGRSSILLISKPE